MHPLSLQNFKPDFVTRNTILTPQQFIFVHVYEIIERKANVLNLSKDGRNPQPSEDDKSSADGVFRYALNMLNLETWVPVEKALSEMSGEHKDQTLKEMGFKILSINALMKICAREKLLGYVGEDVGHVYLWYVIGMVWCPWEDSGRSV